MREHLKISFQWYIYKWYSTAEQIWIAQGFLDTPPTQLWLSRDAKHNISADQNKMCTKWFLVIWENEYPVNMFICQGGGDMGMEFLCWGNWKELQGIYI